MREKSFALITLVFLVAFGGCRTAPGPAPEYTIEQFLGTTSVFGGSFSPDKTKILVSSDESGVFNAYAIPVDGGAPIQLTHSTTDAVLVRGYFPDDERFLYSSDQGGNELNHLYVRELDGTSTDLTPGDGLKARFLGWSQDDESFFVATNERDQRYFDIYEIRVQGYERRRIYRDDVGYEFADISSDRRYIAFGKSRTTTDADIHVYDREKGEMRHLTPHEGEVAFTAQTFSVDGKSLLLTTDEDNEFAYLVRLDLESGEREIVERPDWDVWYAYFSKNGRYLVAGINNDARTEIKLLDGRTGRPVKLPRMPSGDITSVSISRDESMMSFYASTSRQPRDLYVYDFSGAAPRQLTHTINPEIEPRDLVDGEVVRFQSFDGLEIPGVLYRPHGASAAARAPALIWVHGGPGGQSRLGYSALLQYLVNHGYVVFAINNRGSTGYGKTFFKRDDRKHGEDDLDDCVASKKMLVAAGYVDPDRIGIIGGSYGGYMVLAGLTFRPQEFAVGVDLFGISNWVRTLESIPPWWESFREALIVEIGDPEADRGYLRRISPLFHSSNIVKPLMVLQGANDPRVIKPESDDIVAAVRANNVPVEYLVFEDEGHGFRKKENRQDAYEGILNFLDRYLKGEATEQTAAGAL